MQSLDKLGTNGFLCVTRLLDARPMSHQFDLTDDQLQIQDMARKFTADAITPFAAEWDEKHIFPRDAIRMAAELGFGAIYVSEESGGIGLGRLEAALIMEAMAYGCPSTSAFISIQYGELDDRPLRRGRGEAEVPPCDDRHGEERQLLPERALGGIGRSGAQDQGG